ncbi:MAG TPA: hypothetical protein VMS79_04445 [Methanomassiliicoccales archaeon]|nr:hypothetical protein [Methanomassiliicoccales archaeon]
MSDDSEDQRGKSDAVLLRGAKAHMAESAAQRKDEHPITGWRLQLPLIGSLIGLAVLIFLIAWLQNWEAVAIGYVFLYTIVSALVSLLTYLLVKGLASHVRREAMFRRGALEYLRATASAGGQSAQIGNELSSLESIERDAANNEKIPTALYTAFGALPLVGIFVTLYYLRALETVPPTHQRRWSAFVLQVSSAGTKLGLRPGIRAPAATGRSRFVLFAIATILLPPVLVIWYHLLVKENAEHLRGQAVDEDAVIRLLA